MDITAKWNGILSAYMSSLTEVQGKLSQAIAHSTDPLERQGYEELLRLLLRRQQGISVLAGREREAAQIRMESGLRVFQELRERKDALQERIRVLKVRAEAAD